jgi:hypothetical protein
VGATERDAAGLPDTDDDLLQLIEAEFDAVAVGERALVVETLALRVTPTLAVVEREGMREELAQLDAEARIVDDLEPPLLGVTLRVAKMDSVALGLREEMRDAEGQREKDGKGEALRGAVRERVREGKEDSVRETVGERVAEVLQVGGEMVPGEVQAPGQGQGRGAVRAGVGQ